MDVEVNEPPPAPEEPPLVTLLNGLEIYSVTSMAGFMIKLAAHFESLAFEHLPSLKSYQNEHRVNCECDFSATIESHQLTGSEHHTQP